MELRLRGQSDQNQLPRFDPLDLDPEGLDMASLGYFRSGSDEDFLNRLSAPRNSVTLCQPDPPGGDSIVAGGPGSRSRVQTPWP